MMESLWEKIDDASVANEQVRRDLLTQIIHAIRKLPEYPESDELAYAEAYCWYMHPDRITCTAIADEFDAAIRRTLQFDPSHNLARLYRGFHQFDLHRFSDAASSFTAVDASRLTDQQRVKLKELLVCCGVRLRTLDCLQRFGEFAAEAKSVSEYDVLPAHLIDTLLDIELRDNEVPKFSEIVQGVFELLDSIGQTNRFEAELRELRTKFQGK